jgi:predicted transcriptional regulator
MVALLEGAPYAGQFVGYKKRTNDVLSTGLSCAVALSLHVWDYDYKHSYGQRGSTMKTVQMTLDEGLVDAVDKAAKRIGTTRSAFAREALRAALGKVRVEEMERKQREGYRQKPVGKGEFTVWEKEQVWDE